MEIVARASTPAVDVQINDTALRLRIREYARQQRKELRTNTTDALRFGLGQIKDKISELENLGIKDVQGMASRIKRRKHATGEDMYRLSHAFLQGNENITAFAEVQGATQVIIKEFTGSYIWYIEIISNSISTAQQVRRCNVKLKQPNACATIH